MFEEEKDSDLEMLIKTNQEQKNLLCDGTSEFRVGTDSLDLTEENME